MHRWKVTSTEFFFSEVRFLRIRLDFNTRIQSRYLRRLSACLLGLGTFLVHLNSALNILKQMLITLINGKQSLAGFRATILKRIRKSF